MRIEIWQRVDGEVDEATATLKAHHGYDYFGQEALAAFGGVHLKVEADGSAEAIRDLGRVLREWAGRHGLDPTGVSSDGVSSDAVSDSEMSER